MTRSRGLRLLAAGAAVLAAAGCAWVFGGNAYAAKREREAVRAKEKAFGPRAALEAKYASAEPNAEARRAEELAKSVGCDLTPKPRGSRRVNGGGEFSEKERAAIGDYVTAQLVRGDDSVSPPSPELAAILEKRRAPLTAFEEFLVSSPPPKWAFDVRADHDGRLEPNGLGHIRVQRLLVADALAASARVDSAGAARAIEASWKLNEGLVSRPEVVSQLIAVAVARYEVGTLRKVRASSDVWAPRLAAMGVRARLVDALVLDHPRSTDMAEHYRRLRPEGVGWWAHNVVSLLEEPRERLAEADYGTAWVRAIAGLRDEPAFRESSPNPKPGRNSSDVMLSVSIPNIRNSFERADRLALDAELTGKILRIQESRKALRVWPGPSPESSSSRFPGLSWNYRVEGDAITISLSREVPSPFPENSLVLPLSFSCGPGQP